MLELIDRIRNIQFYTLIKVLLLVLFLLLVILFSVLSTPQETPTIEEPSPEPSVEEAPPLLVTAEQVAQLSYEDSLLGELSWSLPEESLLELNRVLLEYQICAPEEISQFLAQVTIETAAGRRLTEAGNEEYFRDNGYSTGTRGAGYLHLTYDYGQMAFSTWMMRKYIPELADIAFKSPANSGSEEIIAAYYKALQTAANLGVDVSRYSRIVYDPDSKVTTGADYIAEAFAWESAGYYWHIAGIGEALSPTPGLGNVDIASARVGGGNWQSRREAYAAFYPIISDLS